MNNGVRDKTVYHRFGFRIANNLFFNSDFIIV